MISAISIVAVGCGSTTGATTDEVVISAAASLTDLFTEMERAYEADHPPIDLILNFGGSSTLREQIIEGAPVDVFASADQGNMALLVDRGLLDDDPVVFATNRMTIAVAPGNPGGVSGLADLGDESLLVGLCAEEVPCGRLAREVLSNADVQPAIDSDEPDVRALLGKIEVGELDVGLVYVTDVEASDGRVEGIAVSSDVNVSTEYPIAILDGTSNRSAAADFVEWVLGDVGRQIIGDNGFGLP